MNGSRSLASVLALLLASASSPLLAAGHAVDEHDTVVVRGNVHPLARPQNEVGRAPLDHAMERMILALKPRAGGQQELERLLAEQQDPASANYHRWLTPEEFGSRFGPSDDDLKTVIGWLQGHGFGIDEVAAGRGWIDFSGNVGQVESTFHTQIHEYVVNGKHALANSDDPSLPRAIASLAHGVVTLNGFGRKPMNTGGKKVDPTSPEYTSGTSHYISPGDFSIIYNVNALYSAGIDGTGQTVAIVGRTHPSATNWSTFRSTMNLPANPPQVVLNGTDPGDLGANEDGEADLDVEWSGAIAKNATVKFVVSKSTSTTDGVDLSAQYIINNNLAAVMSTSFGQCESSMGTTENNFYNNLWSQAASQGITSFVSSGDSGASGCDGGSATTGTGRAVSGLSSTPYNVAVGGTQFADTASPSTYWNSTNATGDVSARSYIPEIAWNESGTVSGGSGLWSTGGGVSTIYAKPSWQVAPGVPADGKRDVPDVSFTAASHDGYLVQTQGALNAFGGTSASSPSWAGLMTLIVQKTGSRQGNANTRFYQLGNAQYGSGGTVVYHDTTSGNNSVPGVTGFSCGTGYDLATGLGSVDANAIANAWGGSATPDFTISASPTSVSALQGSSATSTITTAVSGGFNSAVSLSASGVPSGASASFSPTSIAAPGSGSSTLTLSAGTAAAGTYTVTVTGSGGAKTHTATVSFTVTAPSGDTQLTSGVTLNNQSVAQGAWKYYYITVPSGATNLTFTTTNATGDVDIYTQFNAKPTLTTYVCRPYTASGNETCSATNPSAGTWWLGVNGYAAGTQTYSVTATITTPAATYSISGNAGTTGATVTAGSSSATSDASSNYTISNLAAGTYTVTPSKSGCTFSPTSLSVTVGPNATGKNFTASCGGGTTQLLANPGFESGNVSWTTTSGVIDSSTGEAAHTGSWKAWLDGYGSAHTDTLMQQVTISSTATTATLSFWLHIDTAETTTTTAYDTLKVQIRNSSGTVLATLATYSNLNKNTGYAQKSFDVTSYKGQTIQVYLVGTEDTSLQTSFVVDDFALNVQ